MAPCKFFARGRCTFGASCMNSHDTASIKIHEVLSSNKNSAGSRHAKSIGESPSGGSDKPTCWFFTQGRCAYGESCMNSHDVPDAQTPAVASPYIDRPPSLIAHAVNESSVAGIRGPVATTCLFFMNGFCKNGDTCCFAHPKQQAQKTIGDEGGSLERDQEVPFMHNKLLPTEKFSSLVGSDRSSRRFQGASILYNEMGKVTEVKLASDFSKVQLSGLSIHTPLEVQIWVANLGFEIPISAISIKSLGALGSVAELKVEDPTFAKSFIRSLEVQTSRDSSVHAKVMVDGPATGDVENRIQMCTVSCTWYQPSRTAWLLYSTHAAARRARDRVNSFKIRGRTVECTLPPQRVGRRQAQNTSLQLGNLQGETTDIDLTKILTGDLAPESITWGKPSYSLTEKEASNIVETLLRSKGVLEAFQQHPGTGNKNKATVTFQDQDAASEAVKSLNNTKLIDLGNSNLFLGHVVSVKYTALTAVISALDKELDNLKASIWKTGHVHLKVYPQMDSLRPFTALRVFGQTLKVVAEAKLAIEKLLSGTVAMDGSSNLWDPYFRKPDSVQYLSGLSKKHGIYILRDAKKSQLRMFGHEKGIREAQIVLTDKLISIRALTHTLDLSSVLLHQAMQGGMRILKQRFGSAVRLNVSTSPKSVTLIGSAEEFQELREILSTSSGLEGAEPSASEVPDCSVCWTEATDPIVTCCGHTYCRECFTNQVASSGDKDKPIQCYGSDGTCSTLFVTKELELLLSSTAFENFLQTSFETHIRMRPQEFRYCPTPDCPQIYRLNCRNEENKFFCSSCLTTVCTSCNIAFHDGMSCADYKDLTSGGTKAFEKWKKENDARPCPKCKVDIVKSYGCNHMECTQCGTHICWFCMETFKMSADCYAHMSAVHGKIFQV